MITQYRNIFFPIYLKTSVGVAVEGASIYYCSSKDNWHDSATEQSFRICKL